MATISIPRLSNAWRAYTKFLDKYTWRAQALNTCLMMGAGDFMAQVIIEKRRSWAEYDKYRTVRFLGVGLCFLGPTMHVWYTGLDKIIKGSATLKVAVKKMIMDQCIFLPPYIGAFIVVMGKLRHENNEEIKSKLSRDFEPILTTSYQIWPLIQIVNFYYVPLQHRILVMNLVGLLWNTYIAWKAEVKGDHHIASMLSTETIHDESNGRVNSQESVHFWNKYAHHHHF